MDYDNHNVYPPQLRKKKRSWIVPLLLGILIGIVLMFIITSDTDILEKSKTGQAVDTEIKLDVTTQITDIVEKVAPAVVGVTNIRVQGDYWQTQEENATGTGSGVIYKIDGDDAYVVTNHHVIEGASTVEVVLYDNVTIEAQTIGSDIYSDLAVLRMDAKNVEQVIEIGSSDDLKVGEPAIAIGNPLGHLFSGSVTQGIISGTQRMIPVDFNQDGRADWQTEVIQTDAAINPGNSGGALINITGKLIGINSMKINQSSVEGLGFAIPITSALPIIKELEETGEVRRAYLGVESYSLEEVPKIEWQRALNLPQEVDGGIYIWSVESLSPADKAGLQRLDVITELGGKKIKNAIDLRKVLFEEKSIGDVVQVIFYRNGEKRETTVILGVQK